MPQDYFRCIKDCVVGRIYDSGPVDFVSDMGMKFVLHPFVLKVRQPPRLATWIANRIASGLDTLFLSRFESQRAEYWQTLYSSVVCIIKRFFSSLSIYCFYVFSPFPVLI